MADEAGSAGMMLDLDIARLGAQGDGIAEHLEAGTVFVPFALPGERVRAEVEEGRGRLGKVLTASPDRVAACCRHFGSCGGCTLQHLAPRRMLEWKRVQVAAALAQRGIEAAVQPVISVPPASRRRAVLAARRTRKAVLLGYHEPRGNALVDVSECPVLAPEIVASLPMLREIARLAASRRGELRLTVIRADNGLDVQASDGRPDLDGPTRAALARAAADGGLLRLSVGREPVYQRAEPVVALGTARVAPPPGAFLQACRQAEAAMTELVLEGAARARRVADLFSGLGTFTFPLAATAEVLSVEGDQALATAQRQAVRRTQGIRRVQVVERDLFREPLAARELMGLDAVVLDPPRAGARAQAEALALSTVPAVVAVSCNPATLARDLRILLDGGYRLGKVQPIDQFLFSPHVEVVALLERR